MSSGRLRGSSQQEIASSSRHPTKSSALPTVTSAQSLALKIKRWCYGWTAKATALTFDTTEFRNFDYGYAVTSHSSQGLTTDRVLAHIDTDSFPNLINNRLAYVSISRASDDARIYTNHAESLGERLASDVTKTTAIDVSKPYRLSDVGGASSRSTPDVEFEGFGIAL
jgi:hypothetical protein